jgi:hypothetical protein
MLPPPATASATEATSRPTNPGSLTALIQCNWKANSWSRTRPTRKGGRDTATGGSEMSSSRAHFQSVSSMTTDSVTPRTTASSRPRKASFSVSGKDSKYTSTAGRRW